MPAAAGRFSPLTAPQRALLEAFLADARPWARRQAQRSYAHLPVELHEQAIDEAFLELRTGAPPAVDRRRLYSVLAESLTGSLRRIHTGWCLLQAQSVWGTEALSDAADRDDEAGRSVAAFVEDGLAGLERAVLQLEIGAGRDTATARAALRLGPRQYQRHRDEGLAKLRGAVAGLLQGKVCEQHLDAVTLAATGDRIAAAHLSAGPTRCRSCAREAGAVRRVLHDRLAVAPWPLLIKPAGILAAKLGAVGALFGGKGGAAGGSMAGGSTSLLAGKSVATVLTVAAMATGGAAVLDEGGGRVTVDGAAVGEQVPVTSTPTTVTHAVKPAAPATETRDERPSGASKKRKAARRAERDRHPRGGSDQPAGGTPAATDPLPAVLAGVEPIQKTVDETVGGVRKTLEGAKKLVDDTVAGLPLKTDPKTGLPDVQGTLDEVSGTVESLLARP